jgi:hypothetical protein
VVFCLLATRDRRAIWEVFPVSLILWLTHRNTRYCDQFNASIYNRNMLRPVLFCPKCGAKLGQALWMDEPNSFVRKA